MKNGSFLIPIPNDYEYLVKDKINDTDFTFSVDTMLSVFGSQISLFSIQVTVPGIDDPVDVQVNPGDFKSNVKNIIMINKTPKILQGIALNTDSQKIDNVSAIISNGAITNVILLAFLNGQKDEGGTNSVSYFPAIYFSDSSAYCAYEINSISAMKDFNISFLDRIYEFVTADFKK